MKNAVKQALGAVALSAIALSMIGANSVVAREKADVVKPPPPPATDVEQGQLLDKGPRWKPSVSASANGLCGLPYTAPCVTDAPAVDIETGQLLDKGPRWPHNQKVEAAEDDPCKRPGTQCDPRDGGAPAARNKSDTNEPDPLSAAKPKGKGPKGAEGHGYATPQR